MLLKYYMGRWRGAVKIAAKLENSNENDLRETVEIKYMR